METLSCIVIEDSVIVNELSFKDEQTTLPIGSVLSFTMKGALNPLTSKETEPFRFYVKNQAGAVVS